MVVAESTEEEVTVASCGVLRLAARCRQYVSDDAAAAVHHEQVFAAASRYGARPYLEDFYTAGVILDKMALFGVFDGHGGTDVAQFCAGNLLSETQARVKAQAGDLHKGLHASFLQMDECLRPRYEEQPLAQVGGAGAGGQIINEEEVDDLATCSPGSTAVVAVVDYDNQRVVVANVGDSRAILSRSGRAIDLARAQEPEDAGERARIEATGARILPNGYVSTLDEASTLGMSRSIGDFEFKMDATCGPEQQAVIAVPEIVEEQLTGREEFLVLTSDGIWMPSQEIVDFVVMQWIRQGLSLPLVCNRLMDKADANDNMTVLIVPLSLAGHEGQLC